MIWPLRGVYFFFEPGEIRTTSGEGARVVRVGTHALKAGSGRTLWHRLSTHQGTMGGRNAGGGNHRGSIFRQHVGRALIRRDSWPADVASQWDVGSSAPSSVTRAERPLERAVSDHIRQMPFLWVSIGDAPGPHTRRGHIEQQAIALLSNFRPGPAIDPPSEEWLGRWAPSPEIQGSGLWNVEHTSDDYTATFLQELDGYVNSME
ncbi:MAG: hypothetical protein GX601_07620 [Anaerolineales bacterium]|nr:hypothetical protein [Anaerolineales bacterium]